jgi:cellulose synthase/poly-beta-1,6-N-acetylglucosamine synthase-like glycosyltransferase
MANAKRGVTIITSTIRPQYMANVFLNYQRQLWGPKELIIILNKDSLRMADYRRIARKYRNVRVYRVPQHKTLGQCLNFGVNKAKYTHIAKFDDDDYYGPHYIPEAMAMFSNPKADIVGKLKIYYYFPHKRMLALRNRKARAFAPSKTIAGATIVFRKKVFRHVKFARALKGSDQIFLTACRRKGFKIYTTSVYNFVAFRRANRLSHTWNISDKLLLGNNSRTFRTSQFASYINKPAGALLGGRRRR